MRFDLPADKTLVYQTVIPIRWGDMDAMGHVNNTLYYRYLEILRVEWFDRLGASLGGAAGTPAVGPLIINAFCTFIRQLEYPGDVLARHYIGAIGRSTVDTYATLERTDAPGVVYAEGGATVIWADYAAQKSVPIPDAVRARVGRALG